MSDRVSEDKKFERKEHYLTPYGEYSRFDCTDPYLLINHIVNRILVELRDGEECTLTEVCDCDCIKFKITKKKRRGE